MSKGRVILTIPKDLYTSQQAIIKAALIKVKQKLQQQFKKCQSTSELLKESQIQNQSLKNTLTELRQEIRLMLEQKDTCFREIAQLNQQVSKAQVDNQVLREQVDKQNQQIQRIRTASEEQIKLKEVQFLKNVDQKKYQEQIKQMQTVISTLKEDIKQQLSISAHREHTINAKIVEVSNNLAILKSENQSLKNQSSVKNAQLQNIILQLNTQADELRSKQVCIQERQEELRRLKEYCYSAMEHLTNKNKDLTHRIHQIQTQLANTLATSEAKIQQQTSIIQQLNVRLDSIKIQNERTQKDLCVLRQEKDQLIQSSQSMLDELSNKQKALCEAQINSSDSSNRQRMMEYCELLIKQNMELRRSPLKTRKNVDNLVVNLSKENERMRRMYMDIWKNRFGE